MKFLPIILMMVFSALAEQFLPWWSIAIVCFTVSYFFKHKNGKAFFQGFLAIFLLWGGMAFWIDKGNDHILSNRISNLIFKKENPMLLILLTGIIGGLVGGLSAMAGALLSNRKD